MRKFSIRDFRTTLVTGLVWALAGLSLSGCGKGLVSQVIVTPSEDLKTLHLALQFKQDVTLLLTGALAFPNWGTIYAKPSTNTTPFELGFDLNTGVLLDPQYQGYKRTMLLPNGAPSMLPYAVVEVKGSQPISPDFDLYGYLDMDHVSWLGAAAIFNETSAGEVPAGLAITQVFKRDALGMPTLFASVFGPADGNGHKGGIAVFADVRKLLDHARPAESRTYKPERKAYIQKPGEELRELTDEDLRELRHRLRGN